MVKARAEMGFKAMLALFLALCITQAAALRVNSSECKKGALKWHNYLRAIHQAPDLVWNDTLASAAQAWADSQTQSDVCANSLSNTSDTESVKRLDEGQNWLSPCSSAALSWYTYGLNWSFTGSKHPVADNLALVQASNVTTYWATVIWAGLKQIGCGATQASGGCWLVVCRYAPPEPLLATVTGTTKQYEDAYAKNVKAPIAPASIAANNSCSSDILSIHNRHRAEYQVPPMTWDVMLAAGAQAAANESAQQGCPNQISNLGAEIEGFSSYPGGNSSQVCAQFAEGIYQQSSRYKFTNTPWTDNSQMMGFAYMVAKNMTKLGCGVAKGPDGCWATKCWYGPEVSWDDSSLFRDVSLPAPSPSIDDGYCQQAALPRLNADRANHGALPLAWNSSLAAVSKGLAISAANSSCNTSWLPNDNGVDGFTVRGASTNDVCSKAVDCFYSSGNTTFNFSTRTPWKDNQGTFDQWRYFTQVIWQNTTQVGCGSAQAPDGCSVVICKYNPPGNMQSETDFILNVRPLVLGGSETNNSANGTTTTSSSSSSSSSNNNSRTAIVIGVSVAGGVLVAAAAGIFIWHRRRNQNQKERESSIVSKAEKAAPVTSENNTATGITGFSGQLDTSNMQQPVSPGPVSPSNATPIMAIPGLMAGEPFTRGTAFEYSWFQSYSYVAGVTQSVEAGVNDMQLDTMIQSSHGQVQDCPVVCLSKDEFKQQLQLLNDGLRGRGGAALVFKALWPSRFGPDALLAVKVMKDGYDANPYVLESFAHEASVLASVRHPNVVKLYGYCLDPPNVCLIMELLPCSLKEVLYGGQGVAASTSDLTKSSMSETSPRPATTSALLPTQTSVKDGVPLTMSQVLQVSTEIAAGLAYLHDQPATMLIDTEGTALPALDETSEAAAHVEEAVGTSQKIVHRGQVPVLNSIKAIPKPCQNLKPANILINSLGQVKISDFGLARRHDSTTIETRHVGAGTVPYQAPEILSGSRAGTYGMKATNRCDVYSMAMIFWELLSRRPPWKGMNEVNILSQVINGKRPELPASDKAKPSDGSTPDLTQLLASLTALPAYNDIIRQCWAQRDWRRPTAAEAHRLLLELQQKYQSEGTATVKVVIADEPDK